jgi:hypothetical protein
MLPSVIALLNINAPVSLSVRGTTLPKLAPILSKAFGEPVVFPTEMRNVPMMIRVNQVPANQLRERIAWALRANWEHNQDGWRLYRTEKQKEDNKEGFARHLAAKALEVQAEALQEYGTPGKYDQDTLVRSFKNLMGEEEEYGEFCSKNSPASRLAQRIRLSFNPREINSNWIKQRRLVFSSNPNELQHQLWPKAEKAISEFRDEQEIWWSALAEATTDTEFIKAIEEEEREIVETIDSVRIELSFHESEFDLRLLFYKRNGMATWGSYAMGSAGLRPMFRCGNRADHTMSLSLCKDLKDPASLDFYDLLSGNYERKSKLEIQERQKFANMAEPHYSSYVMTEQMLNVAQGNSVVCAFPPVEPYRNIDVERDCELNDVKGVQAYRPFTPPQEEEYFDPVLLSKIAQGTKGGSTSVEDAYAWSLSRLDTCQAIRKEYIARMWGKIDNRYIHENESVLVWNDLPNSIKEAKYGLHQRKFADLPANLQKHIRHLVLKNDHISVSSIDADPTIVFSGSKAKDLVLSVRVNPDLKFITSYEREISSYAFWRSIDYLGFEAVSLLKNKEITSFQEFMRGSYWFVDSTDFEITLSHPSEFERVWRFTRYPEPAIKLQLANLPNRDREKIFNYYKQSVREYLNSIDKKDEGDQ